VTGATEPGGFFPGFTVHSVEVNGVSIHLRQGGDGPPVLLLHGYPQNHVMWHRVAPLLAERFTVVCPDLRGYGDSDKPEGDGDHVAYSKRTMAEDQRQVMAALGFGRFALAGHDRGARVALRLALDHPEVVSHLAVLDIVPTQVIYDTLDHRHAMIVWRYLFLTQPRDLPERLIGANPESYLRWTINEWAGSSGAVDPRAMHEYLRCFGPATVHATCEDYRAGATVDLAHDRTDSSRSLACPALALWSRAGLGQQYDVVAIWSALAPDLRCKALEGGHFLAEECPEETARELETLFSRR
jgi:haloacetate dehalogenase